MRKEYQDKMVDKMTARFADLEDRIMQDIVRRINMAGKITSTADWQINRLKILGYSSEDIEASLKETLNATYPEMFELYDKVINWEYVRNKDVYEQINAEYIPYNENEQLKQITEGIKRQTQRDLENITQSLGFYLDYGDGRRVLTPLAQVYQGFLDAACMDIVSGAFDYNSVLRRVVTQLTNSGLRQIDYVSGRSNRIDVAARRAIMTGMSQITGKITDYNAEKLGVDHFEVAWHSGARPAHAVWQGKVWTREQLINVCGLGSATGLLGINCYHEYYPFFPGISERNWTDEWLEEKKRQENTPKTFGGKEYTLYEAKQQQRKMETAMRAQREKVKLLEAGGADPDEVMLARAKYQGQLDEYARFSKKMGLPQERERIYLDMRGRVAPGRLSYMERGITSKRTPKNSDYSVNWETVLSNKYKRKYNGITGNVKTDESIYKYAKAGLIHRDGTDREDLYIISKSTGKVLGKNITSTEAFGVRINDSIRSAVKNNQGDLIGLHTHPDNTPPTGSDFETAFKRGYYLGTVACSDGSVYIYGCADQFASARIIDDTIEKFKKLIDDSGKKVYSNDREAHLAAIKSLGKDYGIWYETR